MLIVHRPSDSAHSHNCDTLCAVFIVPNEHMVLKLPLCIAVAIHHQTDTYYKGSFSTAPKDEGQEWENYSQSQTLIPGPILYSGFSTTGSFSIYTWCISLTNDLAGAPPSSPWIIEHHLGSAQKGSFTNCAIQLDIQMAITLQMQGYETMIKRCLCTLI